MYAGALGAPATMSILLDNEEVSSRRLAVVEAEGSAVTVDLGPYADEQQVIVRLLAGRGGSVAVAAASLSP